MLRRRMHRFGARVEEFYVCSHQEDTCTCRTPAPGLLLQASRAHPTLRPSRFVLIGNTQADVEAALAIGALALRPGLAGTRTRGAALLPGLLSAVEALLDPKSAPQPASAETSYRPRVRGIAYA
jgi:phosphoglycolate phosphatase-like HAD superfamily hydrolase